MPHEALQERTVARQRKVTEMLITTSGRPIALTRIPMVSDGAGGQRPGVPAGLAPVLRYFVPVTSEVDFIYTEGGVAVRAEYVLIGKFDDDIQKGDTFMLGADKLKVGYIDPNRDYQTKAAIVRYK